MKWRDSEQDEELISAVAEYLEIVENGGDAAKYLISLGPRALEVQQIAGIESLIRVNIAAPEPGEIARRRGSLLKSITAEDSRRKQTGPKLAGMFAAAGIGLALGAGFASGAVPTEPLNRLAENIPLIGVEASREETDGSKSVGDGGGSDSHLPGLVASPPVGNEDSSPIEGSNLEATQPGLEINESRPGPMGDPATRNPGSGVGSDGTPRGQGGANAGNSGDNGVGSDGTPPGQGGANPGGGGNGVGSDGTPPGEGGANPGGGDNGVGSDGTPPGQGGENPGNGGGSGVGSDGTPPGQGGENPGGGGNGVGSDGTPPGQGGENPGNGNGN